MEEDLSEDDSGTFREDDGSVTLSKDVTAMVDLTDDAPKKKAGTSSGADDDKASAANGWSASATSSATAVASSRSGGTASTARKKAGKKAAKAGAKAAKAAAADGWSAAASSPATAVASARSVGAVSTARKKAGKKPAGRPKQVPSLAPKVSERGKKAALGLEINLAYIDADPAVREGRLAKADPPPPDATKHTDSVEAKAKWLAEQQALTDQFASLYSSSNT